MSEVLSLFLPAALRLSTSTAAIYNTLPGLKSLKFVDNPTLDGFTTCKPLTDTYVAEFSLAIKKFREEARVDNDGGVTLSLRIGNAEIQSEQASSSRILAGTSTYFHPVAQSEIITGFKYKSAASVGVPPLRAMPMQNSSQAHILEQHFIFLDLIARLILCGRGVDKSLNPLLHGEKQMWFLDHITLGSRAKNQAGPGVMQMHRDSPYYGHAIVVFNVSGKAEITIDYNVET
jgi:hypothetical protein